VQEASSGRLRCCNFIDTIWRNGDTQPPVIYLRYDVDVSLSDEF